MYRLAVFPIALPPLRERDGDAELLAEHFLQQLNDEAGTDKRFSRAALVDDPRRISWPGNVRELKNAVHRAFIMADDDVELDLAGSACPPIEGECLRVPIGTPLAEMERQAIFATLDHCAGNKRRCRGDAGREPEDALQPAGRVPGGGAARRRCMPSTSGRDRHARRSDHPRRRTVAVHDR